MYTIVLVNVKRFRALCGFYAIENKLLLLLFSILPGKDWIMKRTDIGVKSGIIWTFTESLEDLDFADDISLLAHSHRDIQSKTEKLVRDAVKVGLHVNKDKTKTMRNNCQTADPVKLGEQDIEDVTEFTYLVAKVTTLGTQRLKSRQGSTRQGSICGSEEHLEDENDQQENKDTHFQEQRTERTTICCRVLESDQRNMPHAGSIPKQVPQENSAHLLAKHDNQCGAPRTNWDAAHLVRSKEKKMEVDWPRKQYATDIYSKNSHALDPRRKREEGPTKREAEKVRGA